MSSKPNKVLIKATTVIELLAQEGALSPAEIAASTGIARSSAYRLVDTLVDARLAEHVSGSRVRLTRRWLSLADTAALGLREWSGAQAALKSLAQDTRLTAYLTVHEHGRATCIAWSQGSGIDLLELRPGRSLPLNAGAAGRCFLAFDPEIAEVALANYEFPLFTDNTLTSPESLRNEIELSQKRGYALSDEDVTLGVGAVGVPLFRAGHLIGCISLAGLTEAVRRDHGALAKQILQVAQKLV